MFTPYLILLPLLSLPVSNINARQQAPTDSKRPSAATQKKKTAESSYRTTRTTSQGSDLDVEVESVSAAASAAPAEFAADALIRLAEASREMAVKKDLLERAWLLAAGAQNTVRRKLIPLPGYPVDTAAGYSSYAFESRLDTLSLRTRIIKLILKLDRQRSRELLDEMSPDLKLKSLSCEDTLVYDVSDFFDLLREVAQQGFNRKEKEQGAPVLFVDRYISAIKSASQVEPAIRLILSIKANGHELSLLAHSLIRTLDALPSDDRSFTQAVTRDGITQGIFRLQRELEQRNVFLNKNLLRSYRDYLRNNLGASRCMENAPTSSGPKIPLFVREANNTLFRDNPLTADDLRANEFSGKADVYQYWQTTESKRLLDRMRDLRFRESPASQKSQQETETGNETKTVIEAADKESVDWQLKFNQFLADLDQWTGDSEKSRLHCFHHKQVLYQGLVDIAPLRLQPTVFASWVNSLSDKGVQSDSRIDWFLHVRSLTQALQKLSPGTRNAVLEQMIDSSNPALSLYGRLTKLGI